MNLSKMMALLLAPALLLALAPAALSGTVQSGTLEGGGTWELDADGVLTIGGPASLLYDEFDYDLQQMVHKVVYGPEVVEIAPGVFSYSYDLTAFEVDPANPNYTAVDGVLYNKAMTELIEAPTAFAGSLVVPEGVKTLRYNAFIGTGLTGITLPESLETIEEQCFWNSELAEITLPAGLTNIEDSAFTRFQ